MNRPSPEFVSVYTAHGALAGEMIRAFLEAQGIPAMAVQESAGQTLGLTVGSLGMVKIYVPEMRLEEAEKLLEDMEEGEFEETRFAEVGDQEIDTIDPEFVETDETDLETPDADR